MSTLPGIFVFSLSQASGFLFCGLTFSTGMLLLCFCALTTVYTEPSAFPSVNTPSSLQVQSTQPSALLQCAWQSAHRPAAFFSLTPGMEFLSVASCSSLCPEHPLGHDPAQPGFQTSSASCSACWVCSPARSPIQEGYPVPQFIPEGGASF